MKYARAFIQRTKKRQTAEGSNDQSGPLRFVAATEGLKGDMWHLQMSGIDLSRFESNGVVLWAHDYWTTPPIGRADAFVEQNQLMADVEFDLEDPLGASVDRKYRNGFLNAVSIGFDFAEGAVDDQGVVSEWELLEISAVPVPMDPEALLERQRAGARQMAELARDPLARERWAEATRRAALIPGLPGLTKESTSG